ncbi:MAG: type IV toxin-antitoxin system AbiEi family antitoxin domain-containing protein [Nitrospirales bacterium]|nr:type IV toxin-antitoxin system AbiEi family antitoxin domain-containing protein [Nitrospirales bacterium]
MKKEFPFSKNRTRLSTVLQTAGKLVSIDDAERALDLERDVAAKMLSRWVSQGWLVRVGPGLYAPVPLDALTTQQVIEDPWVLVPALFDPCYIGGWTAAGYWDFTEQIFRSILVFTAGPVRKKLQTYHGTEFVVKHTKEDSLFGIKTLWRGSAKVSISDKHRTIIDMLDTPETGGGITHVFDCLKAYLKDQESDTNQLIDYAARLGNGAVFKRLGFLAEQLGVEALLQPCREGMTTGNAKLDPSIASSRLLKRWNLWIPKKWA